MQEQVNPFSQLSSGVSKGFQLDWTAAKPKISPFLESWLLAVTTKQVLSSVAGSLLDRGLSETPGSQVPMQQAGLPCGRDAPPPDASTETG